MVEEEDYTELKERKPNKWNGKMNFRNSYCNFGFTYLNVEFWDARKMHILPAQMTRSRILLLFFLSYVPIWIFNSLCTFLNWFWKCLVSWFLHVLAQTANMHCICNLMKNFAKPKELTHRSKTLLLFSCIFGWGSLYISNVCSRWKSSSSKGFHSMALVVLLKDYAVV